MLTVSVFSSMYRSYSQRACHERFAADDLAAAFHKRLQNAELIARELHLLAVVRHGLIVQVQDRAATLNDRHTVAEVVGTAQNGANFCHKHGGVERLCDKIIAAMSTAITIFIFSDALETKMIGTADIFRISLHQW